MKADHMNCHVCDHPVTEARLTYRFSIGGTSFASSVGGARCTHCPETFYDGPDCVEAELLAARRISERGPASPDGFAFLRGILDMSAQDLAPLLGRRAEALSRWENGRSTIDPAAWALLGSLVLEKLDGVTTTLTRLKTLAAGKPPPKNVRIVAKTRAA